MSHSNVQVPGKYASKSNSGSSSPTLVGRPSSGICPLGSVCLSGGGCAATVAVTALAASVVIRNRIANGMYTLPPGRSTLQRLQERDDLILLRRRQRVVVAA